MRRRAFVGVGLTGLLRAPGAGLTVYATNRVEGRRWRRVRMDGAEAAELRAGWYFRMEVEAGRHALELEGGAALVVEARAGEERYARLGRVWPAGVEVLEGVPAVVAERDLRVLQYLPAERIRTGLERRRAEEPGRLKRRDETGGAPGA